MDGRVYEELRMEGWGRWTYYAGGLTPLFNMRREVNEERRGVRLCYEAISQNATPVPAT
jgi:hypothetical protein